MDAQVSRNKLGAAAPGAPIEAGPPSVSVVLRRVVDRAEGDTITIGEIIEAFCKPRLVGLFGPLGDRFVGLFAFLAAVSVLIPFPGTNFPPSIALVIASIAVMEEDGYLLIGAYLIGLAGLAYTAAVTGTAIHLVQAGLSSWFGF